MAAKRYRSAEHRTFHRAASYTDGRSMQRSRDERAVKRKSTAPRLAQTGPSPERDCTNVRTWFRARGLKVDEHALFAELMAHAF